jgi:D-glycero-D-manno-heptose 1,7-bisphosphate phosphatase
MIGRAPTIFLDRDGVINRRHPGDYVRRWEEFVFLPRVKDGLVLLSRAGFRLIVMTNQRGVARGLMTQADLDEIHRRMRIELTDVGATVAAVYACVHDEGQCDCRKPRIGLFRQAQAEIPDLTVNDSVLVGDSLSDLDAGCRVGCRTFLVADEARCAPILLQAAAVGIPVHGVAPSLYEVVRRFLLPAVGQSKPPVADRGGGHLAG